MAYWLCGIDKVYTEEARILLNSMVISWATEEIFLWSVIEHIESFSAPSKVLGDEDGDTYICYLSNTGAAINRPTTGANNTRYWYKSGSGGVTWVSGTAYSSTGEFSLDSNVMDLDQGWLRFSDKDLPPLEKVSRQEFDRLSEKQETGQPSVIYFEPSLSVPKVHLHPQIHEDSVDDYLLIMRLIQLPIDLVEGSSLEYLKYWYEALYYNLAYRFAMMPTHNVPMEKSLQLRMQAEDSKRAASQMNAGGTHKRESKPLWS